VALILRIYYIYLIFSSTFGKGDLALVNINKTLILYELEKCRNIFYFILFIEQIISSQFVQLNIAVQ